MVKLASLVGGIAGQDSIAIIAERYVVSARAILCTEAAAAVMGEAACASCPRHRRDAVGVSSLGRGVYAGLIVVEPDLGESCLTGVL